jgi:hypothetical protein
LGLPALADQGDQALGGGLCLVGRRPVQEQGEFVGADPGRQVLGPRLLAQDRRHGFQQAISSFVAERVVDQVEGVDVQEQQRPGLIAAEGPGDPLLDLFHEPVPVAEPVLFGRLSHLAPCCP